MSGFRSVSKRMVFGVLALSAGAVLFEGSHTPPLAQPAPGKAAPVQPHGAGSADAAGAAQARGSAASSAATPSACVSCHGQLEDALGAPVKTWTDDVHAAAGLGCESCHGGNPSPALAEDGPAAMDARHGFQAHPDRLHMPQFCGRCHADAAYMKRYNPQARVDQLAEYRSSVHGKLNAKGDPVPAVCTDCHGAHGIRAVTSPEAPVYATNVPETCARCHANPATMKPYGIPTNQYEDYRRSAHAAALLDRGDTSAPACNDCHGNHGAAPPGVQSVAHVCGQCHGREAALYQASFKKELFDRMGVPECTVCHDNHRVRHPTPGLFHGASGPQVSSGRIKETDPLEAEIGDIPAGGSVTARWVDVLRPSLPPDDERLLHRVQIQEAGAAPLSVDATVRPGPQSLSPEIRRASSPSLSLELTIEPQSGVPIEPGDALLYRLEIKATGAGGARGVTVRDAPGQGIDPLAGSACLRCHEPGDACDKASETMYSALSSLDRELREASGVLRRAELAGMEVSAAKFDLKRKGTTAAVEARSLIHSFDPKRLIQRTEEGRGIGRSALQAGTTALEELQFRRKGLAVSLVLIGGVLTALFLKIRQVDRTAGAGPTS